MTAKPTPLPLRNDTILGVCEALGQDFGINPLWLRLAFVAPLFVQPVLTIAAYFGVGLVVAAARYFYPRPAAAVPAAVTTASAPSDRDELPLAA